MRNELINQFIKLQVQMIERARDNSNDVDVLENS